MNFRSLFRTKSIPQILADIKQNEADQSLGLVKNLQLRDLIAMGIAAIIGAGIFSTIGNACADGGPAVSLLFVFTAIACVFSALCYAEFASTVPISGSAYTYAYTTFGELIAWILGWNLLFEYAIGNITVAISWSDYFTNLLNGFGIHIPDYLTMDYLTAYRAHNSIQEFTASGQTDQITDALRAAGNAWDTAPMLSNLRIILDIPALFITLLITWLIIVGIKESKMASNIMVVIKLVVVMMVISIGIFYVNPDNWSPFAPTGVKGVLSGVSAVFFAYIGFDAISTTAEECKDPQRDLPKAMMYCLIICTILYILITLVLTGMVNYKELRVGDPLAYVFGKVGLNFIRGIVAVSAVVAMSSVFLVFQLGQPRIWMSMSRDGLLPKKFASIHPKFKTPAFSSIIAGLLVAIPSLFLNLTEVTDLCSIGTLFAFALVSGGVLLIEESDKQDKNSFRVPYFNGKYIIPLLLLIFCVLRYQYEMAEWTKHVATGSTFGDYLYHRLPMLFFVFVFVVMTILTFMRNLSIIPVLGLLTNVYLMSELGIANWVRFLLWCVIGFIIYFAYSYRNSKLATAG